MSRKLPHGLRVFFIVFLVCVVRAAHTAPLYRIEDIGPSQIEFNGPSPRINDSGQVILAEYTRLLRYTDGTGLEELGVPAGHPTAANINNRGQVVGRFVRDGQIYAYRYTDGVGLDALVPLVSNTGSFDLFLNDRGQFAGSTGEHGFLYTDGSGITTLPHKYVWDINNRGDILAGDDYQPSSLFTKGRYLYTEARGWEDIRERFFGRLGAGVLNDTGMVAGFRYPNPSGISIELANPETGESHSVEPFFMSSRWYMGDLNNQGQAVGVVWGGALVPFVGSLATGWQDLNTLIDPSLGYRLYVASDINERGQIVGIGRLGNQYRTLRLTPTAIPEPGTLALLGVALVPLLRRKRT